MKPRGSLSYTERRPLAVGGFDPDEPTAGFYRMRMRRDSVFSAVRVWFGPPIDPADGLPVPERGHRWQASINGEPIPIDRVWPRCAKNPIAESEYEAMTRRRRDAGNPHDPHRPVDLMRAPIPI